VVIPLSWSASMSRALIRQDNFRASIAFSVLFNHHQSCRLLSGLLQTYLD
jgi:hypothetical protein